MNPYTSHDSPQRRPTPPAGTSEFSVASLALGLVGAVIGGAIGFFAFQWIASQGFYALAIPGALLGLGFSIAARRSHVMYGVICAVLAFALSLFSEWRVIPFIADDSLSFFLTHLNELKPLTWIMIAIGTVIAFSCGRGRR